MSQGNLSMQHLFWWHICPYQQYLSCYLTNFDQTSRVGFWGHLYCISFMSGWPFSSQHLSIYPYQQYIHCYWPNLYHTFWTQFNGGQKNLTKMLLNKNFFWPKSVWTNIFLTQKFWRHCTFRGQNGDTPQHLLIKYFLKVNIWKVIYIQGAFEHPF